MVNKMIATFRWQTKLKVLILLKSIFIIGCANNGQLIEPVSMSDQEICSKYLKNQKEIYSINSNPNMVQKSSLVAIRNEFLKRGLTKSKCNLIITKGSSIITKVSSIASTATVANNSSFEKIYNKVYEQFIGIPQGRYSVVADTLNVRIRPDISGKVLTSLNKKDEVFVYESSKNWARISDFFDGASYGEKKPIAQWVSSRYLNLIEEITHKQLTNRIQEKIAKKNEKERQRRINQRCSRALVYVGRLGKRKAASKVSEILNELDGCNGALGVSKSKLVKLSRDQIYRCNKQAIYWQHGSKTAAYNIRQLGGCNGLLSHL